MAKTIISKRDLDAIIRNHMLTLPADCAHVVAMPVVWRARVRSEPNWAIPGWSGDSESVRRCVEGLNGHLRHLRSNFDIPDEQ